MKGSDHFCNNGRMALTGSCVEAGLGWTRVGGGRTNLRAELCECMLCGFVLLGSVAC